MTRILSLPLAVLLPLARAACSQPPGGEPPAGELPAATLAAHHWRRVEATEAAGARIEALFARPDAPVQLDFADGRVAVSNTCNAMDGAYTLENGTLSAGPMAATRKACVDPKLAALDGEVGERLEAPLGARLEEGPPPRLVLASAGGARLVFEGVPTPAARYGGTPERMFLEVAAETRPCSHPLRPGMQCMQVREIRYDDKGLKVDEPGEWRNFYDQIEGYTHQPGVRNVLRLDRYTRDPVPADANKYAYVLDMVVESETVKPL